MMPRLILRRPDTADRQRSDRRDHPSSALRGRLGASNYTYAEAVPSQEMPLWIACHVHAFEYLGAVPEVVVRDNLKAGVIRAHRYESEPNATYPEMAAHYDCVVLPRAGASKTPNWVVHFAEMRRLGQNNGGGDRWPAGFSTMRDWCTAGRNTWVKRRCTGTPETGELGSVEPIGVGEPSNEYEQAGKSSTERPSAR